jgi:hypothetical protein
MVCQTLSQKNPSQKRTCGAAQGLGPEFKPQHHIHKKNSPGDCHAQMSWLRKKDLFQELGQIFLK